MQKLARKSPTKPHHSYTTRIIILTATSFRGSRNHKWNVLKQERSFVHINENSGLQTAIIMMIREYEWMCIQSLSWVYTLTWVRDKGAPLGAKSPPPNFSVYLVVKFFSNMVGIPNKWLRKAKLLFLWRRLCTPSVIKRKQNKDQL